MYLPSREKKSSASAEGNFFFLTKIDETLKIISKILIFFLQNFHKFSCPQNNDPQKNFSTIFRRPYKTGTRGVFETGSHGLMTSRLLLKKCDCQKNGEWREIFSKIMRTRPIPIMNHFLFLRMSSAKRDFGKNRRFCGESPIHT